MREQQVLVKQKHLQVLAENLSDKGIPVLLMDIKGDLSGIAQPSPGHPKIDERHAKIGLDFEAKGFPVEIMSCLNKMVLDFVLLLVNLDLYYSLEF